MCNACGNVCCGSDMFGGCGCDGCDCEACWSDEPEDECLHEDYEINIIDGRASCSSCAHVWNATDRQMERHEELMREDERDRRYWDRVDEGRQRAKDRDI